MSVESTPTFSAKKLGFSPDIFRILNKYSISQVLNEYIQTGVFPSKVAWKNVVRSKINALHRDDMLIRINFSELVSRIVHLHSGLSSYPHAFWILCREHPRYKNAHAAVRLIGLMLRGRWRSPCHKCGENVVSITEHVLLFCRSNSYFRTELWQKLIKQFGLAFYIAYISLSVSEQVNALLSGFSNMLHLESDRFDSTKLFFKALKLLMLESRYQNIITL